MNLQYVCTLPDATCTLLDTYLNNALGQQILVRYFFVLIPKSRFCHSRPLKT